MQVLIECKKLGSPLGLNQASQLFRYFAVAHARVAILTDGDEYRLFTDLDAPNRMDDKPFLVLRISDLDETLIPELQKLTKDTFDIESVVNAAEELKYIGALKRVLAAQYAEADADWVKFLAARVYDGPITQKVRDQFSGLVRKAQKQFLADQVNDRLKAALGGQGYTPPRDNASVSGSDASAHVAEASTGESEPVDGIETTLEELEAFHIVRAIACSEVPATRIVHRDTKSYMGVLLDDNNRKPIARLHFNTGQKYLGLFDEEKNETRHPIDVLADIYAHAGAIRETVHYYE